MQRQKMFLMLVIAGIADRHHQRCRIGDHPAGTCRPMRIASIICAWAVRLPDIILQELS